MSTKRLSQCFHCQRSIRVDELLQKMEWQIRWGNNIISHTFIHIFTFILKKKKNWPKGNETVSPKCLPSFLLFTPKLRHGRKKTRNYINLAIVMKVSCKENGENDRKKGKKKQQHRVGTRLVELRFFIHDEKDVAVLYTASAWSLLILRACVTRCSTCERTATSMPKPFCALSQTACPECLCTCYLIPPIPWAVRECACALPWWYGCYLPRAF